MLITIKYDDRLSDGLTAYWKHKSCETSLIGQVENWKLARGNRLTVERLSTDMSKAFDSLYPPPMLCKFKAYGFQDRALDLLHSCLWGRLERERIGSVTSSWRNVDRGCPRGLPTGIGARTAIVEHISQRYNDNVDSGISMYADDHQIYVKGKDMWQEGATLATNWYDWNLLQGTLKKYRMMNIRIKSVNYGDKTSITVIGKDIVRPRRSNFWLWT